VNDDGLSDLVVGANNVSGNTGAAYVFQGVSGSGPTMTPWVSLAGPDGTDDDFGQCVFGATN
jgi:hypothetical protein